MNRNKTPIQALPSEQKAASVKSSYPGFEVKVRMYCMGTGDFLLIQVCNDSANPFNILIDCGSAAVKENDFRPYVENLAEKVNNKIDLLVVTHEHNDHVNGFAKCIDLFENIVFKEAWFAWTEDPADSTGAAQELKANRNKIRQGLSNAMNAIRLSSNRVSQQKKPKKSPFLKDETQDALRLSQSKLLDGLESLAAINLSPEMSNSHSLPGMKKIKELLESKKVKTRYLYPGETLIFENLPGIRFHILGPPGKRESIFKSGKEGIDVFTKKLSLDNDVRSSYAFLTINDSQNEEDFTFHEGYFQSVPDSNIKNYQLPQNSWRTIDDDWLNSVGSIALRLNSHINNTSLVFAIESEATEKVLLFPGDAEYGSWESWHEIEEWKTKGKNGKPWAEDLLNRTVFYKVGHHLSYNGTALQRGIMMMKSPELTAMATLDLKRIISGWTATMPSKHLLDELDRLTNGRLFIMNDHGITRSQGATDPSHLRNYSEELVNGKPLYKEYNIGQF
jgi:ribonuclease BN (tRNA processing enzyme)